MSSFTGRLAVNTNGSFPDATDAARGLMTATDHQALTQVWAGWQAATALATPNTVARRDANGDAAFRVVTAALAGNASTASALGAGADRTKLDGIQAGAQVNPPYSPANTAGSVVQRDGNGDFSARIITATLSGNAATATSATTATTATTATNATTAGTTTGNAGTATALQAGGADRAKLDRLGLTQAVVLAADTLIGQAEYAGLGFTFTVAGLYHITGHAVLGSGGQPAKLRGLLRLSGVLLAEDQQATPAAGLLAGVHVATDVQVNAGQVVIFYVAGNQADTVIKATNNESPQNPGRASYIRAVCVG